jgi:CubicO group peptidase (beta-lactamase class C family)
MSAGEDLDWEPGTKVGYSSSGVLLAAMLMEDAMGGAGYEAAVASRLIGPAGLTATEFDDTPIGGYVGYSTGGLRSNIPDLLTWGSALYRDKTVNGALTAQMTDISNEFSVGLGLWPVCPCSVDAGGAKVVASYGHNGGTTTLQFSPADKITAAADFSESFWTGDHIKQQDVYDLLAKLRSVADAG